MHSRSRSRLPMQILSIIVIITLVIPPSLVVAAPAPVETQNSAPIPTAAPAAAPKLVATLLTSAGFWVARAVRSMLERLDIVDLAPAPAASPLPEPPADGREVPSTPGPAPWVMRNPSAAHRNATIGPEGGRMATPDNAVEIVFPPNVSPRAVELRLETSATKSRVPENSLRFTWLYFSLDPVSVGAGASKHLTFEQPVTITIDVSSFPDWTLPVLVHEPEEDTDWWDRVPSDFDLELGLLTAQVTEFSAYQVVGTYDAPTHFMMLELPQTSAFNGSATYSYKFDLPAGRNGLAPSLSLDYSSGTLNGLKAAVQSNYVGLGWNLGGMSSIVRKMTPGGVHFENEFTLALGGTGYRLFGPEYSTENDLGCRYYAEGAPELRIIRYTAPGSNHEYCGYASEGAPSNQGGEYWIVTTPDGTEYRMGYSAPSEQIPENDVFHYDPNGTPPPADPDGYAGYIVAFRWAADLVTDVYGNTMTFGYYEDTYEEICLELTSSCSGFASMQKSQIPDYIRYTGDATTDGPYLVDFVLEDRTTGNDSPTGDEHDDGLDWEEIYWEDSPGAMWDSKRIAMVRVCTTSGSTNVCPSTGIIAEYDLDYQFVEEIHPDAEYLHPNVGHETTRLVEIIKSGWASGGAKQSLPSVKFDYGVGTQATELGHNNMSMIQVYDDALTYPRLLKYYNGYGATVEIQYDMVEHDDFQNRRVAQREISDGLGNESIVDYDYEGACFSSNDASVGCLRDGDDDTDGLVGHDATTVTVYDYDSAVLSKQKQYFNTGTSLLQGKMTRSQVYEGDTLVQQTDSTWTTTDIAVGVSLTDFAYLNYQYDTTYTGGASETLTTTYSYDTADQDGGQYGMLTRVQEYDETNTRRRITLYLHDANETKWVIVPRLEAVFHGSWGLAMAKFNLYDGNTDVNSQTIDIGELTATRVHNRTGTENCPSSEPTVDTAYIHDDYGNVTSIITYEEYGTAVCINDDWQPFTALGNDSTAYTSTLTYDSPYNQYPVETCAAVGTSDELCSQTEYYGVNETATTGDHGLFGQVQRTIDANGAVKHYVYDAFGRLERTRYPDDAGFADGQVSERAQYSYDGNLGQQRVITRQGRGATWQEIYYDGLGRTLQVHQKAEDGQEIRTTTAYDALGRAVEQWTPYYGTQGEVGMNGAFSYVPAASYLPHTVTRYDALGQAVRVETPDGSTSTSISGGRTQIAEDANGHVRLSHSDALGRMTAVNEALSDWSDGFNNGVVLDGWTYSGAATETGGTAKITGSGSWSNYVHRTFVSRTEDDQGILVSFKYDSGTVESAIFLDSGAWAQPEYRRFGLRIHSSTINVDRYFGTTKLETPLMSLATGVWYRLLLKIDDDGTATAAIWEIEDPAVRSVLRETRTEYAALNWKFMTQVHTGVGYLDDYDELTFHSTTYTYDTLDSLTVVTDTLGNAITMTYDGLGRKTEMTDPDMGRWYYTYDPAGNLLSQVDANKQATNFYYNARDQVRGKTYSTAVDPASYERPTQPGTYPAEYAYDETGHGESLGRRTTMTDTAGTTVWTYDERGRVTQEVKTISGSPFTTTHTYNAMDQVLTTTYPDGEVVTTAYNDAMQPESLSSTAATYVSNVIYTAPGQLAQVTAGNGVETTYTYNSASRRLIGLQVEDEMSLSYGNDRVGNVLRMDEQQAVTFADSFDTKDTGAWAFNAHQTVPRAGWDNNVLKNTGTGTNWDANFYRTSYNLSSGEALQVRYKIEQTDNFSVMAIETNDGGVYRRFGVNINDGRIYVQYNDGSGWAYPKDLITAFAPGTWYVIRITLDDGAGFKVEAYAEDDASTYESYTRTMSSGKNWRFRHWVYRGNTYLDDYLEWSGTQWGAFNYDALNRLESAAVTGTGAGLYNNTYTYDPIGNLTSKSGVGDYDYAHTLNVSACTSGTPNVKPHAVDDTNADTWTFSYDCNGNMTSRNVDSGNYTLTYNEENKLASAIVGSETITYTYDGDGTLVMKVIGSQTTVYVGPHFEKNLTTGVVTKYYYLSGQRVAMRVGSTVTYLHGDHLGSASLSTNASGTQTGEMRYHAYGATRSGSVPTDRRYTGQREESGLGLYDYNARYYDPELSRFIQADTIVPNPGNPQDLNRFSYVRGNPLRYSDPTGHCIFAVDTAMCIAAAGMAAGALYGYSKQVIANRQAGMSIGDALTTDIDPDPIVRSAFLAGIAVTGGSAAVAALGIGAVPGTTVGTALLPELMDGDDDEWKAVQALQQAGQVAQSPTGQRTIHWLADSSNRVSHIMQSKHNWDRLVDLTGDASIDYQSVQQYIQQTVDTGVGDQIGRGGAGPVMQYVAEINGQELVVRGVQLADDAFQIADAWVKQ